MSFGSTCDACGIAFSSRGARGFFPDRRDRRRGRRIGRCSRDVARFYRDARRSSTTRSPTARDPRRMAGRARATGAPFRDHFLVPVTSAVWSTAADRVLDFPVAYLLRFLDNHGLIGFGNAPQWRVVRGGSQTYVERLLDALPAGLGPGRARRSSSVRRDAAA